MNKLITFCASLAFLVGVSYGAGAAVVPGALDIDFRDASFDSPCNGMGGCVVGGITVFSSGLLDWTANDGFGVRGGEPDEINFPETLTVSFSPRLLTRVWFTDMFAAPDGGGDGEEAIVQLFLSGGAIGAPFTFFGEEPANTNNGGQFGSFGGSVLADMIVFASVNESGDEYAVAGLTVVPLPGALGLMISGLVAFVVMARRRRKVVAT